MARSSSTDTNPSSTCSDSSNASSRSARGSSGGGRRRSSRSLKVGRDESDSSPGRRSVSSEGESVERRKVRRGRGRRRRRRSGKGLGEDSEDDEEALISGGGCDSSSESDVNSEEDGADGKLEGKQKRRRSKNQLILYGGIAIILCLVLLASYLLYKTYDGLSSTNAGSSDSNIAASNTEEVPVTDITTPASPALTSPAQPSILPSTPVILPPPPISPKLPSLPNLPAQPVIPPASGNSSIKVGSNKVTLPGVARNGIGIGFLPDYQDHSAQFPAIAAGLGTKLSFYGWYAQVNGGTWDGSQLLDQLDSVKASGAIFQPAVMPSKWIGFTAADNHNAIAVANVLKKFTDEGIIVWLRFAHEVNFYQTDGTYVGDVNDFKAGWAVVAAACRSNPLIKMFFTPNIASLSVYKQFYPTNPADVDIIGIDYYPAAPGSFVSSMKPFHDAYCTGRVLFAVGETGLSKTVSQEQRVAWLAEITSPATKAAMPYLVGVTWFNYVKEGVDFRIYDAPGTSLTSATKNLLKGAQVVQSGAVAG